MLPIAFAGEPGAFAEDAVIRAFGDVDRLGTAGFREVFEAVAAGVAAAGVVPIENLLNGTVRETYDLLLEHDLVVVAEVIVPVRLCLAALPGERLDSIERVYSHIQALGQAEAFLRTGSWATLTTYNTAGAGKMVADSQERGAAAVLSPRAAALFGLEILAGDIQGSNDNRTRFLVIERPGDETADDTGDEARDETGDGPRDETGDRAADAALRGNPPAAASRSPMRTTLAFAVRNEPGSLLRALSAFANRGVNLSKLESRPSRTAAWEYVFWADVDASPADASCAAALDDLRSVSTMVRVFGSYPRVEIPDA